jgi:predicted kinase
MSIITPTHGAYNGARGALQLLSAAGRVATAFSDAIAGLVSAPAVVVICGPPCSGKSTIAESIAPDVSARYVRFEMDQIQRDLATGSVSPDARRQAYEHMHSLAAQSLREGARAVVLDATYQPHDQRRAVQALAARFGARVLVFECKIAAEEAVRRFLSRPDCHPATDLYPQRVRDLAIEYPPSPATAVVHLIAGSEGRKREVEKHRERILRCLAQPEYDPDPTAWYDGGNQPDAQSAFDGALRPSERLTEKSRRNSWWLLALWACVRWLPIVTFVVAAAILAKAGLDLFTDEPLFRGVQGSASDWTKTWLAVGAVAGAVSAAWGFYIGSDKARSAKATVHAGSAAHLSLTDRPLPTNPQVYERYRRRLTPEERRRMPLRGVPIWFLEEPSACGFTVQAATSNRRPTRRRDLAFRAAQAGFDWTGYLTWRTKHVADSFHDRFRETGLRALNWDSTRKRLTFCKGSYQNYACTELAANMYAGGKNGFELRQILEDPTWTQPNGKADDNYAKLRLSNVSGAARTYEMFVGVQVAITTADHFLIMVRRSQQVSSAGGGAGASAAGSVQWKDKRWWRRWNLWRPVCPLRPEWWRRWWFPPWSVFDGAPFVDVVTHAALREAREEIGFVPHPDDDVSASVLGAAFNLLRGRDLNFYCHLATHWTFEELANAARRRDPAWKALWLRIWRKADASWPGGPTRGILPLLLGSGPRDAWEVDHLIPIPIALVREDGTLGSPFSQILGDARHPRGLLYSLAKSDRFRELQKAAQAVK